MDRQSRGEVLVCDDDENAHDLVRHVFDREWTVHRGYNVPQGISLLRSAKGLRLALVDLDMPGPRFPRMLGGPGAGFWVVVEALELWPTALVVVCTAYCQSDLVNTAQWLGAEFVSKTNVRENLRALERRVIARAASPEIAIYMERLALRFGLSPHELDVLIAANEKLKVEATAQRLGVSSSTVRKQRESLLEKCDVDSVEILLAMLRAGRLPFSRSPRSPRRMRDSDWSAIARARELEAHAKQRTGRSLRGEQRSG